MVDKKNDDSELKESLDNLTTSLNILNEAQTRAEKNANDSLKELQSINRYSEQMYRRSLFTIEGIVEKILSILFDGFVEANQAQSDFNTILTDSNDLLLSLDKGQGNLQSAMKNQFRLLEVGFKKDNKTLRDLLFLEQVGMGHDQDVIGLIGELVAAGIDQGSINNIVDSIADVAMNTSRTAEATVAALVAQGDLQAAFGAMGLSDEIAQATLEAGKELGLTSASQLAKLGEFIARLYDPEEIGAQAFLGVLNKKGIFSKDINVLKDAYISAAQSAAVTQAGLYQQAAESENAFFLNFVKSEFGQLGDLAIAVTNGNTEISDSVTNGLNTFGSQAEKNASNVLLTIEQGIKSLGEGFGASIKKSFDESNVGQWITGTGPESLQGVFDGLVIQAQNLGDKVGYLYGRFADGVVRMLGIIENFANSTMGKTAIYGPGPVVSDFLRLPGAGDPSSPFFRPPLAPDINLDTDHLQELNESLTYKNTQKKFEAVRSELAALSWIDEAAKAAPTNTTVKIDPETMTELIQGLAKFGLTGNPGGILSVKLIEEDLARLTRDGAIRRNLSDEGRVKTGD